MGDGRCVALGVTGGVQGWRAGRRVGWRDDGLAGGAIRAWRRWPLLTVALYSQAPTPYPFDEPPHPRPPTRPPPLPTHPPLLMHPPLPAHPPFYRRAPTSSLRGLQRRRRGRRRRRPLCLGHHRVGGDDGRPRRPHLLPPRRCGRHLRHLPPVWWRRLGVCRRQVRGQVRAGGIHLRGPIQCFANASCTDGTCIKCVPAREACGGDTAAQCFGNASHSGSRAPPSPVGRETATALRGGASPPASPPPRVASFRPLSPPSARPARSTSRRRPPPPTPPAACTPSPPPPYQ